MALLKQFPSLLLVICLIGLLFPFTIYAQTEVRIRINNDLDDLEEYLGTLPLSGSLNAGDFDSNSSDLELGRERVANTDAQLVGLRFNNVSVPKGVTILSAYINFTVDATAKNSDPSNLIIRGEDVDHAAVFNPSQSFNLSSRPKTTDTVAFSFPVGSWANIGDVEQTADISNIIQSIVDRPGWNKGNSLALFIEGTGIREAESHDDESELAPELVINYDFPLATFELRVSINDAADDLEEYLDTYPFRWGSTGNYDEGSSDLELGAENEDNGQLQDAQLVGLRFNNLDIPANAYIVCAYISFTVDETNNLDPSNLIIHGEDIDDSPPFDTSQPFNLSSRTMTDDSVQMSYPEASWSTVGDIEKTNDISTILQEIIDRPGWTPGNSISLFIKGTGRRIAESYERTPNEAAELFVEYAPIDTASYSILRENDDVEETGPNHPSAGSMDMDSGDLDLGINTGNNNDSQYVGIRFDLIDLLPEDSIISAYIQFTNDEPGSVAGTKYILIEDTENSSPYINSPFNLSNRDYLADTVTWNAPVWNAPGDVGLDQRSPDVSHLIKQIIKKPDWEPGNALSFFIAGNGVHEATSFNGNTGPPATLVLRKFQAKNSVLEPISFPFDSGQTWRYFDTEIAPDDGWKEAGFDYAGWRLGEAEFGYGDGDEETILRFGPDPSNKIITYFFTLDFEVPDKSIYESLLLKILRDDGAIVYLNGKEIYRTNMPAGPINNGTLAITSLGDPDESTFQEVILPNDLVDGINLLAVEVHQASPSSSDLSFDLALEGILAPAPIEDFPIRKNRNWAYLADSVDQGTGWRMPRFNYSAWDFGPGQLGYGEGDEATELDFGPDSSNKYITSYFIKEFLVDPARIADSITLGLLSDDGAVVYLNGMEIIRQNMPQGAIDFQTLAIPRPDSLANIYEVYTLPGNLLRPDSNYLAVEVHLADTASSTLSFDLFLHNVPEPITEASGCQHGNDLHIACFTSIMPQDQGNDLVLPGSHAFQLLLQEGESYTNQAANAPGFNNMAAYIPRNGSSKEGYLNINHESPIGGVSILDIHYDTTFQVWLRDEVNSLEVENSDLAYIASNSSGSATPWGTFISSESTYSLGDLNGDGFVDAGWNVEIDPTTRSILDYGNGKTEKLWAMGRMRHANVAIAQDSVTVYQGEDGGSSAIFKFVANRKGDLSSGALFVLKLGKDLVDGKVIDPRGTWVRVSNSSQLEQNTLSDSAISLGTNFNQVRDVEINPRTGDIYFASAGNHQIYRFKDLGRRISNFEVYVDTQDYAFISGGNLQNEAWGSGNDNLEFDNRGNLWVSQNGSRRYIWMIRSNHESFDPRIELFASLPQGAEATGISFTPDHTFMFLSIQHPATTNGVQIDDAGQEINHKLSSTLVIARNEFLGGFDPTTQLIAQNPDSCNQVDLSWKPGSGFRRLIVARVDTTPEIGPIQELIYLNPSSIFGQGDSTGPGNYVIFEGNSVDSIRVKGLSENNTYIFTAYEAALEPQMFVPLYYELNPGTTSFALDTVLASTISGTRRVAREDIETYGTPNIQGYSFEWIVNGGSIQSGQSTNTITVQWDTPGEASIELIATNDAGCTGTAAVFDVFVDFKTGLNERLQDLGISLYPNPTVGQTTLEFTKPYQEVDIQLFNTLGVKKHFSIEQQGAKYRLNLDPLNSGYYMLRLRLDGTHISLGLIKE